MKDTHTRRIDIYKEYCTGCGLCASVEGVQFYKDEKGFSYPELSEDNYNLCSVVCPASGYAMKQFSKGTIWGNVRECYAGWSTNEEIRHQASTGGVLTALACYLLEKKIVDGIIQVKKDKSDPRKTIAVVNYTSKEVISCCGSRYTESNPLSSIKDLVQEDKKYAFIGKPCDVSALRMYQMKQKESWVKQIKYMLSFFCAGQPSEAANDKLLLTLGCDHVEDCLDLTYRGNGWPGETTVTLKNGVKNSIEYEKSWMTILGRDVRKCCRFCADGTGELADVSCGDAWYLNEKGKPDFNEASGRNVIFGRTERGIKLLKDAIDCNYIHVENFDIEKDALNKIQPYHYNRKASLGALKLAMLISGRKFPLYEKKILKRFSKGYPLKNSILRFAGMLKRIWSKKL